MVTINELDKRIKIMQKGKTSNGDILIHECWAKVNNTTGSEIKKNGIEIDNVKTRFLIRYTDKTITNKHIIVYKNKKYNIVYVQNYNESNDFIEILAEYKGLTV